jgi:hypothetical protein
VLVWIEHYIEILIVTSWLTHSEFRLRGLMMTLEECLDSCLIDKEYVLILPLQKVSIFYRGANRNDGSK